MGSDGCATCGALNPGRGPRAKAQRRKGRTCRLVAAREKTLGLFLGRLCAFARGSLPVTARPCALYPDTVPRPSWTLGVRRSSRTRLPSRAGTRPWLRSPLPAPPARAPPSRGNDARAPPSTPDPRPSRVPRAQRTSPRHPHDGAPSPESPSRTPRSPRAARRRRTPPARTHRHRAETDRARIPSTARHPRRALPETDRGSPRALAAATRETHRRRQSRVPVPACLRLYGDSPGLHPIARAPRNGVLVLRSGRRSRFELLVVLGEDTVGLCRDLGLLLPDTRDLRIERLPTLVEVRLRG